MFRHGLHSFRRGSLRAIRVPALLWLPLVAALGAAVGGWWGVHQSRAQARVYGAEQLALAAVQVRELLDRYELFPEIAAFCPCVGKVLADPDNPAAVREANGRLADIRSRIRADAAYVLDTEGKVLAASNWATSSSFVGQNYSRRPYFQEALAGGTGRFVGIGLTSGKLGYYLARAVSENGRIAGVIAVKLDLVELQRWLDESARERRRSRLDSAVAAMVVADAAGVIFVSTEPDWQFRTLQPLDGDARARIERSAAYAGLTLEPLPTTLHERLGPGAQLLSLPERGRFIALDEALPAVGWQLRVMVPLAAFVGTVHVFALLGLLLGLLVMALLLLLLLREIYQRRVLAAAIRDPLTGLYSRLYMNETAPRLIARHARDQAASFGVVILDVDHFKRVNDRFGHFAGDRVLAELSALIRTQCDDMDLPVRLGGEEFAVFHVQASAGATLRLAERLRILIAQRPVRWEDQDIPVSISGGVAEHRVGEGLVDLLQRADRALYQAKHAGRNRVIDAEPPTEGGLPPGLCAHLETTERATDGR
jgi:diguanylate cyclase (GGDEF)-like protein